MNTTEEFGNLQKTSEDFSTIPNILKRTGGVGRGKKYPGAEIPDDAFVGDDYIVMEDAYALFDSEGERRSMRMIAEYCKTGELVCSYDSDDKRWHITQESVENKIKKIKALNARKTASFTPPSTSEHFSEEPATPHRTAEEYPPRRESAHASSDEQIKKLEQELIDLKIMNKGKDFLIAEMREDRAELITRIETHSHLIGQLETKLLRLEAARPTPGNDNYSPPPLRSTVPPVSKVSPDVSLSNNASDNYEHSPQEPFADEQR